MKLNSTTRKWLHNEKYVRFKSKLHVKDSIKLSKKEFFSAIQELLPNSNQITHTTVRTCFKEGCFALSEKGQYLRLTWRDKQGYHQRYTNFKDDNKNKGRSYNALAKVMRDFKKRTNVTFKEAFGTTEQYFKRCVIGLFHYDNPLYYNSKLFHIGKLDFSSHFPSCACGLLPDANTAIEVEGIVEPTEEYPFAFYKSGFVAEYNKYNTRDWYGSIYRKALFESEERVYKINADIEESTILMKASSYNINEEMMYYYNQKLSLPKGSEERDEAKLVLLKIIGQLEMNDYSNYRKYPYAHLAAIIKARAVAKMLKLIERVGEENVVQIIVDGLLFINPGLHLGDKTEHLGSLQEEFYQAYGKFKGHNQYVLMEGTKMDICHAGYDIDIGPDISKWKRSPVMHLKESIEDKGVYIEDLNYEKQL